VLQDAPAGETPLVFPVASNFISRVPRIDPQAMLQRLEENLRYRLARPGERERRATEAVAV